MGDNHRDGGRVGSGGRVRGRRMGANGARVITEG